MRYCGNRTQKVSKHTEKINSFTLSTEPKHSACSKFYYTFLGDSVTIRPILTREQSYLWFVKKISVLWLSVSLFFIPFGTFTFKLSLSYQGIHFRFKATVLLRLRFFRSIPNSHTACVLNFYHIQWCWLSSIRHSPILRQIYLQLVLKIISHYCYSFIFGKLSFLLLLFYFHVQTNYFKTYAFKSLCTLFQNLSPFYDVSHTWLSAVVSFRAFQIPCLAIQTLILNFALLVIRFLLLHSIPQ